MINDYDELVCVSMDDGSLVFEARESLTEDEKERADFHIGTCLACQRDMETEFLFDR